MHVTILLECLGLHAQGLLVVHLLVHLVHDLKSLHRCFALQLPQTLLVVLVVSTQVEVEVYLLTEHLVAGDVVVDVLGRLHFSFNY